MNSKKFNILLADDDTDDCLFFKEAVEELPLSTNLQIVHDGEQLMRLLTHGIQETPDVLFLDLNMPRKNGFECLTEIKLSKTLNPLPVIIFSTSFEQAVVNLLYANGAQYFIRKPSEFSQFKKIIQQTLNMIAHKETMQPQREDFVLTVNHGGVS